MRVKTMAAVLIATGTSLGMALPASAAFSDCKTSTTTNRSCLWGNDDFVFLIANRGPAGAVVNLSGDADNNMDSWANRTSTNAAGYTGYNGGGSSCFNFPMGANDNNVAPFNSDQVSSWKTNGGC